MPGVFDYVNNVCQDREEIEWDEKSYNPYIINKALSNFPDTVMLADVMNRNWMLPKRAQYLFYLYGIKSKKKRWGGKWGKAETS